MADNVAKGLIGGMSYPFSLNLFFLSFAFLDLLHLPDTFDQSLKMCLVHANPVSLAPIYTTIPAGWRNSAIHLTP